MHKYSWICIYILYQISPTCFGAYCTIFRDDSFVTCSKLSAYCNVVTLGTKHKINIIIYVSFNCCTKNSWNGNLHDKKTVQRSVYIFKMFSLKTFALLQASKSLIENILLLSFFLPIYNSWTNALEINVVSSVYIST